MAFNFNWSPLIADTERVRDMLTNSLNKSPKPPIIVDDILVNELNLGSTPPSLEILEIGDLAEDRFRGIFKMSYSGDAYLTLKTRVQANPLNTFLSTKPSFASPQPLAASSGLTIPLQITLSDIRLSGFVILVFSKQKGITLVFRNDPLESLKVSSTFDAIPFVRDYLQRTIESQLRTLFMEDLPAIIHKLSLRLWSQEHQTADIQEPSKAEYDGPAPIDPFASPAQQPLDAQGDPLEGVAPFTLDTPSETYASFSQKNLLRLAALAESQRTLSLFTPGMRDTVYRAWANAADRGELSNGASTPLNRPATLSRIQSTLGSHSAGSSSAPSQASDSLSQATRPSLATMASAPTTYTLGSTSRPRAARKRKNRIVDLRKDRGEKDASDAASVSSGYAESASQSASGSANQSMPATEPSSLPSSMFRDGEVATPPRSPRKKVGFQRPASDAGGRAAADSTLRGRPVTPRAQNAAHVDQTADDETPRASLYLPEKQQTRQRNDEPKQRGSRQALPRMQTLPVRPKPPTFARSSSEVSLRNLAPAAFAIDGQGSSGGILEQAWMMKMATEIARRVAEEKTPQGRLWRPGSDDGQDATGGREAPPAYAS
ncbi:hypothetical protein BAUCODRAFT_212469 [Baudoinia panamericana UAMH 10762]|uniref:Mitochondrial distribution and morphology protein 34 n=1 Tax=Baudoinia panamericana (strain UAMH 10762) TaxID=717646 RepID=M2N4A4_BAUPA|nr:uncharacterized protein BAUCODRAFT_212469 [Baudoinia panamericana UAMH 10762]EMC93854.1 hypothetical protein BAUCODRAFT_212469 [Baudoinia panamericana UAMH 10762]